MRRRCGITGGALPAAEGCLFRCRMKKSALTDEITKRSAAGTVPNAAKRGYHEEIACITVCNCHRAFILLR